jgi:hypothetical protein
MSMADVFSFALAWDFPGLYLQLQEQDGTSSVAIGCLSPAWATLNVSKLICDQSSACQVYSDETFRAFAPSPGFKKITFMSTTRCAGAQKGVNISGGCLSSAQCYWQCAGSSGNFAAINPTPFPYGPLAVRAECDANPVCVGFVINALGTQGTLLMPDISAPDSYNLKLPGSCAPSQPVDPVKAQPSFQGAISGFAAVPYQLTDPATEHTAFGPCAATPDPHYTPSLMSGEAMKVLCAANPALCTHFAVGGGAWRVHSLFR